jgi:hypothetical protein
VPYSSQQKTTATIMMNQFPPSSSVSSAKLVAINSAVFAIRETAAAEDDPVKKKEHSESSSNVKQQDQQLFTKYSDTQMKPDIGILSKDFLKNKGREQTTIANSAPSIVQTQSTAVMKPDIGILSKDFLKSKGREPPIDKQFAIHRKKQAVADVDVGILDNNGRRQKTFDTNLHAKNEVAGRLLQSEYLPWMCPGKNGLPGWLYFSNLFNVTDRWEYIENLLNLTDAPFFTEDGYFPKCSCSRVSPTTCGPNLCECLEYADGDILQCLDSFNQLCEGTKYIEGIPGPWSMEECLGNKRRTIEYCSILPCFVEGGSYWQCSCQLYDSYCTASSGPGSCARSKCCQAQTDDEGREACILGGLHENYYDQVASFSISNEEKTSRFNECSFNSDGDKSIVQCYCESFSYGLCVNWGVGFPDYCEAMNCCFGETEDDARLDCFSRFRDRRTGFYFYNYSDEIQESCVASGRSSDQCKCDILGLSNCVGVEYYSKEPNCDLFQCCQSQTGDNDDGRKDCLVQDEAQLMYAECINNGNTTESCVCDKSNTLCSSEYSDNQQCELSSCCQEQENDKGRKKCIAIFTTNQPSSAPSSENIPLTDTSPSTVSTLVYTAYTLLSTSTSCLTL